MKWALRLPNIQHLGFDPHRLSFVKVQTKSFGRASAFVFSFASMLPGYCEIGFLTSEMFQEREYRQETTSAKGIRIHVLK